MDGISEEDSNRDLKEAFSVFDKNGDGLISKQELSHVMQSLGYSPTASELVEMIKEVDLDGDGYVDYGEFVTMMSNRAFFDNEAEREINEAFRAIDRNGDGFISAKELKDMMKSVGQKVSKREIKAMIKAADANGDGKVSLEEFKSMMNGGIKFP